MSTTDAKTDGGGTSSSGGRSGGPLGAVLDLFSSVRFGVVLLVILFVYSSIGSAGILYPVGWNIFDASNWRHEFPRTWRGIELTEFEWFHTWFFDLNIALICLTMIVTTIRRIRFNVVNLGVWMIHAGIVILAVGSVIYFTLKVEGDAPVTRRQVKIEWPGQAFAPATLKALPGSTERAAGPGGEWSFRVANIDPEWPLMSGDDAGKKTYSVTVMVQPPGGAASYMRQLLVGYPQYTEDVIPGKGRVKKQAEFGGRALVDESLAMSLEYATRGEFWLMHSAALYAREAGTSAWVQRPIRHMPRYNDYLPSVEDAFALRVGERLPVSPLDVRPAAAKKEPGGPETDPLAGYEVRIVGFLRYATERERFVPGEALNPVVDLRLLHRDGNAEDVRLVAMDPQRNMGLQNSVAFRWVERPEVIAELENAGTRLVRIRVPGMDAMAEFPVFAREIEAARRGQSNPFRAIGESGWMFRVVDGWDNLDLADGRRVSVLTTEIKDPDGKLITRWVADDPTSSKDVGSQAGPEGHPVMVDPDPRIEAVYVPRQLPAVTVLASPGESALTVLFGEDERGRIRRETVKVGGSMELSDELVLTVTSYLERGVSDVKPAIVPREQRQKDIDDSGTMSRALVEIRKGEWSQRRWAQFHRYSHEEDAYAEGGYSIERPAVFTLEDGRNVEVLFSRQRRSLPHRIALEDFVLTENVGGFEAGRAGGIRDWTSVVRFSEDGGKTWGEPRTVSTNNPTEVAGWWYFQSFWDPPRAPRFAGDAESRGLNLTGLGVGNRHGVYTQLVGCAISVAGMLYAFYVKPIIKRRRRERVLADVAAGRLTPRNAERTRTGAVEHDPVEVGGNGTAGGAA